jgi:hypothetical protein
VKAGCGAYIRWKGLRRGKSIKEEGGNNPNERVELKETNEQKERKRTLKADGQRKPTPPRGYVPPIPRNRGGQDRYRSG